MGAGSHYQVETSSGSGVRVPLPFAPEGKRLKMPFHLEWLNADANRSKWMNATAVASACSSSSRLCAPDWVIAGTGNAGSTALYMQLVQHPQLVPARVKEVNHLGLHSNWLDRGEYSARLAPASGSLRAGELLGEASPYYLSNPVAPSQLRYLAPRAKVILVLRSPPAHCWSGMAAGVVAALDAEQNLPPQRDRNSEQDAVCHIAERAPPRILANYHPCDPLHYLNGVLRWLDHFPPSQLHVLLFEAFASDQISTLNAASRFLDVAPYDFGAALSSQDTSRARNRHAKRQMPLAVRVRLEACHANATRQLVRLLQSTISPGIAAEMEALPEWRGMLRAAALPPASHLQHPAPLLSSKAADGGGGNGGGGGGGGNGSGGGGGGNGGPSLPVERYARPRVGVVIHTYGRRPTPGMSAMADNVACYCAATRSCTLFYEHTRREVMLPAGTRVAVPWYDTPLVMNATQNDGALNRPGWPVHQFAKLLQMAKVWERPDAPDWLWFIDADTRLLNFSVRIDDFVPRDECGGSGRMPCEDIGLVVVDHPWAGIVTGSLLVRRSPAGLGILRDLWECQQHRPPLAEQSSLADALMVRTAPRTNVAAYVRHQCMSSAKWLAAGFQGMTQCWNYHMARMGHPYGHRSTAGVRYVDPAGADFQAFTYYNYGDRADEALNVYGTNVRTDPTMHVQLPLHRSKQDIVFQRGDLLVHSSILGGARRGVPELLDAVGALPGKALRATNGKLRAAAVGRSLRRRDAIAAADACTLGPRVEYAQRPLNGRTGATAEVFIGRRRECPNSNTNVCDPHSTPPAIAPLHPEGAHHVDKGRGAADSSASTPHPRCVAMQRAARAYDRMRALGVWEQSHCPTPLGWRNAKERPSEIGTACEPWIHRGIQFVLSRVLDERMHALEWSTGSSSMYYVMLVASLHSIEHDAAWAQDVQQSVRARLPAGVASQWKLDTIVNSTAYGKAAGQRPGTDESLDAFRAYVNVPLRRTAFDFVSVDGRARSACLARVWREELVAPGGVLLLDNSLRAAYREARAPFDAAWVRVEFNATKTVHPEAASALWCRSN